MAKIETRFIPAVTQKVAKTVYVDEVVSPAREEFVMTLTQDDINYLGAILGARNFNQRGPYLKEGEAMWNTISDRIVRQDSKYLELRKSEQRNFYILRRNGVTG